MLRISQRGAIAKPAVAAAAVVASPVDARKVEALRRIAERIDVIAAAGEGDATGVTQGAEAKIEMVARVLARTAPSCAYHTLPDNASREIRAPSGTQTKRAPRMR